MELSDSLLRFLEPARCHGPKIQARNHLKSVGDPSVNHVGSFLRVACCLYVLSAMIRRL